MDPDDDTLPAPSLSGETPSTVDELLRAAAHIPAVGAGERHRMVARRYRLVVELGQGAQGWVWEAEDTLSGERVALKILKADLGAAEARVRREIAALRLLRVPGVARLLDEGADDDRPFIVMERVHGEGFPGESVPVSWPRIAPAAAALLETLARMHALGVIHRDLKPANVLVDAEGLPTILDFGLARPLSPFDEGITDVGQVLGTPAYLAPEQLRDESIGPTGDLYAVGVMLYHALSGCFPHPAAHLEQLFTTRTLPPAAPLAAVAPSVPAPVAELVDRLIATDPMDRPRSAAEVREAFLGHAPAASLRLGIADRLAVAVGPHDEHALREIFAGPSRLFHIPEDAACALHRRTLGEPSRVAGEVAAWVRAGIARPMGDRIAIDQDAIDRLDAGLVVLPAVHEGPAALPRLFYLLRHDDGGPGALREIAAEALACGRELAIGGRLGRAAAVVAEGLRAVRRRGRAPADEMAPLLSLAVEIALAEGTARALDHVLYEVVRVDARAVELDDLAALVRAALAVFERSGRALSALSMIRPFADPALELLRQGLRVRAARACPVEQEEAAIAEASRWVDTSGDGGARAARAGWLGRLRYRQSRFAEAAALQAEAAGGERWATAKLAALLSSASAQMEAFQLEEAAAAASEALSLSRSCRLPLFEARAEWLLRAAAYRTGAAAAPDRELCEAAALLGPCDIEAMICLNEAAVAFRAGDPAATRALAGHARRVWASLGERQGGALLAAALDLWSGAPAQDDEVGALVERALGCGVHGVGIQVLGLVALAGRSPPLDPARVDALSAQVPAGAWGARLDVLSVREARDLTAAARRSP